MRSSIGKGVLTGVHDGAGLEAVAERVAQQSQTARVRRGCACRRFGRFGAIGSGGLGTPADPGARTQRKRTQFAAICRLQFMAREPARLRGFRHDSRPSDPILKIVVSPVRVRVSPFSIPHDSGIFFFFEEAN